MSLITILTDKEELFASFYTEDIVALIGPCANSYAATSNKPLKILLNTATIHSANPLELVSGINFSEQRIYDIQRNIHNEWKKQSNEVKV